MSNVSIPESHRAVVSTDNPKGVRIVNKPLPVLTDDRILIKVRATSVNPTDWKSIHVFGRSKDGNSIGSDFAGDVVKLGKNAGGKGVNVGDAVAGFVLAHNDPSNAGFQEYVVTRPESVTVFPKDKISYEEAASFPVALSTAVQALYHRLGLPTPWEPAKEPFPILIWAGSTSVGLFAIKLAKLSNLLVATTASPKNHALLKQVGADAVYDYKDPEAPRLIKEWSKGRITHGLDAVSEAGSAALAAKAFSDEGGKLELVLPVPEGSGVANVQTELTLVPQGTNPDFPEFFQKLSDWHRRLPEYAAQLRVVPLKIWEGGLDAIPQALDYIQAGKVSAQKLIIRLN